jgi:hypothetical protein
MDIENIEEPVPEATVNSENSRIINIPIYVNEVGSSQLKKKSSKIIDDEEMEQETPYFKVDVQEPVSSKIKIPYMFEFLPQFKSPKDSARSGENKEIKEKIQKEEHINFKTSLDNNSKQNLNNAKIRDRISLKQDVKHEPKPKIPIQVPKPTPEASKPKQVEKKPETIRSEIHRPHIKTEQSPEPIINKNSSTIPTALGESMNDIMSNPIKKIDVTTCFFTTFQDTLTKIRTHLENSMTSIYY